MCCIRIRQLLLCKNICVCYTSLILSWKKKLEVLILNFYWNMFVEFDVILLLCINFGLLNQKTYSRGISIQFRNEEESTTFHCAFEQWKKEVVVQECPLINGAVSTSKSKFDDKIEASSAKMYFHYYGQLLHQQNMLQDFVRTGILNFDNNYGNNYGSLLCLFTKQSGIMYSYLKTPFLVQLLQLIAEGVNMDQTFNIGCTVTVKEAKMIPHMETGVHV
ncbi:probable histone-arginine methyltransferase CARM1 [Lycium barbarum]|uniref:probable histone-arginine methyltransferase CARM1 n=1 Tax=Lycium barbarum TaxID=112863 RepID=UPI00293F54BC|nr:probable histone-arginine methyltransferase CARM1 [Lycium barbarum]